MKQRIENFFANTHLFKIYIFGWFSTGSIFFLFFFFLVKEFDIITCLKIGVVTGLLFGLILTLTISQIRKSVAFWKYAKEVEVLIEEAETQERLKIIFEHEYEMLRDLSLGGPHSQELEKLYYIMKTKFQYVKEK